MNSMPAPASRKLPLICTLAAGCSFVTAHSVASETQQSAGSVWMAVSDEALDDMRGGFDFGAGLVLNFGIDRAVYINGALVTSTTFNFNNLTDLKPEQLALLNKYAPAANLIQNGAGNTFEQIPTVPQGTPATATTVAQNPPASPAAVIVGSNLSPAAATFIQNTLNNQHIQSVTVINATVNTLGVMRSLNSLSTLQQALASAIHSRL
jgi:hypothetical protein